MYYFKLINYLLNLIGLLSLFLKKYNRGLWDRHAVCVCAFQSRPPRTTKQSATTEAFSNAFLSMRSLYWIKLKICCYFFSELLLFKIRKVNRDYGRRDPPRWPRGTLYPQKLTLTSPTSGNSSVGIVRSRNKAMELVSYFWKHVCVNKPQGTYVVLAAQKLFPAHT
jgi:hypothetical protein